MKKPDFEKEAWILRRLRLLQRDQIRAAKARRRLGPGKARSSVRRRAIVLSLPTRLTAGDENSRQAILTIISTMLDRIADTSSVVKLDFSAVQRIFPGGMLMLLAHAELIGDHFPGRVKAVCPPGSMAGQLLVQFGFGQKFSVTQKGNTPRHSSVTGWRFATGDHADGAKLQQHIESFASQVGSSMPDGLYNALSEAMVNVRHHAYPADSAIPESLRRWWMFSSCRSPTSTTPGELYLAFYDVGVGIQSSLRKSLQGWSEHARESYEAILERLGIPTGRGQDVELLRVAVEHNRTSTGLPFRGKGLPEMKEFAATTDGGRMSIMSGFAQYSFQAHLGRSRVTRCQRRTPGTLILWNLPLIWKEVTP